MIILLLVSIFCLLVLLYAVHKKDIMYPSIILCITYIICITFAVYNWEQWGMAEYSLEASGLTFLGVSVFAIVGIFVEVLFAKRKYVIGESNDSSNNLKEIVVQDLLILLVDIFCVVTLILYFSEVRRIAGGVSEWSSMMLVFHTKVATTIVDADENVSIFVRQMTRIVLVQGYLFGYILVNNVLVRGFKVKDIKYLLPVIFNILQTLLSGARSGILYFLASIFAAGYILWHRKHGWDRNLNGKYVRLGAVILAALLPAFYFLKGTVGRISELDPISYISVYVGGAIKLFDMYVQSPPEASSIFGYETFYGMRHFLSNFGIGKAYVRHLEFRSFQGLRIGNTYTALRRYHSDFGILGIIILMALFSFIMHYHYCKVKYSKKRSADFLCLLYCYLFFTVPMTPIDDVFYSNVISGGYLINIILLYILYYFLVKRPLHIRILPKNVNVTMSVFRVKRL